MVVMPLEAKTAEPIGHAHIANNIVACQVVGGLAIASAMASGAKHAQEIRIAIMKGLLDPTGADAHICASSPVRKPRS